MRQKYLAEYYGVPQCDVSFAVAETGIRREETTRENVGCALSLLYEARYERMMIRATRWLEKKVMVDQRLREYRKEAELMKQAKRAD